MKEQEKDQQFRTLCDDYRNLPPMEVLHPVLIDKVHRRKFIVVGQIYHPVKKRTCLCVFREDTLYFEMVSSTMKSKRFTSETSLCKGIPYQRE